ncbi:MAG: ribonuclease E/G [Lachnospiraceae bacterium]|nr:ribonuclease E/G [Lachnospiraceae bacterium]
MGEKKIVIAEYPAGEVPCLASVLYEDDRPVEFFIRRKDRQSLLGNIYVGKVETIQNNLNAAFVRLGPDQNGYLPLPPRHSRRDRTLKAGDEIVVQVEKEAMKQKLPRLTQSLAIPGRFLVLTSERKTLNLSRKLKEEDRKRLEDFFRPLFDASFGIIVRTNAAEADEKELLREWEALSGQMKRILDHGAERTCYSCLYQSESDAIYLLKQCPARDLKRLVTDDPETKRELDAYIDRTFSKDDRPEAVLYADRMVDLYKLYNLTTLFEALQSRTVWLKSGGFLVIEQTEAFVSVDVNTGRYSGNKSFSKTVQMTNDEAAPEIARQIRLRQLSGTILVDFINMREPGDQKRLRERMTEEFRKDPSQPQVIDITALDIMEITRTRKRKSFKEQLKEIEADG